MGLLSAHLVFCCPNEKGPEPQGQLEHCNLQGFDQDVKALNSIYVLGYVLDSCDNSSHIILYTVYQIHLPLSFMCGLKQ